MSYTSFSSVSSNVRRWWRSRGHGVHSPFAFRFIRGVLREKAPYYNYSVIEGLGGDVAWHKLLFRLVCEFEPMAVMSSHLSEAECKVIELADSRVALLPPSVSPAHFPPGAIEMKAPGVTALVIRDLNACPHEWERLHVSLESGMTFTNGTTGIVVVRPDLPRQDFEINF